MNEDDGWFNYFILLLFYFSFESPIFLAGAAVILVVIGLIAKSLFGGKSPEVTSEKATEKKDEKEDVGGSKTKKQK